MADLNRNELEALRILWSRREALKPAEIQAQFAWPIENATLRSALALLVEKEQAVREKRGKAFHYRAANPPESVLTRMARSMAHVFSGGSPAGLIAQLMRVEKVTPEEIEELRRAAEGSVATGATVGQALRPTQALRAGRPTVGQAFQPAETTRSGGQAVAPQSGRRAGVSQAGKPAPLAQAGKPAPLAADRTSFPGGGPCRAARITKP